MRSIVPALLVVAVLAACEPGGPSPTAWRSALYPADWTPATTGAGGRFLHDFSWAGYRHGEDPPIVAGPIVDATTLGADSSGANDSTAGIQAAIDAVEAAGGGVVHLPAGRYRVDGVLVVESSGVVVRGDGPGRTFLAFGRHSGMTGRAHLTFQGRLQRGPDRLLAADAEARDTSVRLTSVEGLSAGDEIAIGFVVTDDFRAEHGMSAHWDIYALNRWKPFFRRTIARIDGTTVHFEIALRYRLRTRDAASVRKESGYLTECGVEELAVATAASQDAAWAVDRTHAVALSAVADSWIRNVHSFDPGVDAKGRHLMSGGLLVADSKRVTVAGCRMAAAQNRGPGGNGYLFEIGRSGEVLVRDCEGRAGRHNFIQNWDFGTSGCVFLRVHSHEGRSLAGAWDPIGLVGHSEYHHSLAMANLVDDSRIDDGWSAVNRGGWSSGAGHSSTACVFWNAGGKGTIRSKQFGWGYVIGTGSNVGVETAVPGLSGGEGTAPADHVEGEGKADSLVPASLYEDQRRRRLGQ